MTDEVYTAYEAALEKRRQEGREAMRDDEAEAAVEGVGPSGYRRLDKVPDEDHLDSYRPYVARLEDGTEVLVSTYWTGGALKKVTVATRSREATLPVWGPPVEAIREDGRP